MKRFIAAAFTLIGLVFAVGCVGAPDSDGAGGDGAADEPGLEVQGCPLYTKLPVCASDETVICTFVGFCRVCRCLPD